MSLAAEDTFAILSDHELGDTLPFYQLEGQVLELWDQLQELKLECALLETQIASNSGGQVILEVQLEC